MPETMSPREKVERAIKDAIRDDAGVGLQMTLTPRFMRGLVDRVLDATAVVDNEANLVSGKPAALASSGDHAELENAGHIVWWKEGGVSYFPEGESFTLSASCRVEPLVTAASASALIAQVAALRANEKVAMKECAEWARKAGEAIGKLETSEAAGIVEGWQDRATEAERKLAEARSMLLRWRRHAPTEALEDLTDAFLSKEAERG